MENFSSILVRCPHCNGKVYFSFATFIGKDRIWDSDDLIPIEILAKVHGNPETCTKCLNELIFKVRTTIDVCKAMKQIIDDGE